MDPLIGREREIAVIDEALATALRGQRAVVLISGEPGIGKTRLLDELELRVQQAGGRAVWGRTWDAGMTPAFWPWMQVLASIAEPGEPAPELVSLDDRADAGSRLARFDQVAAFLVRRASERPIAVLLDDLHAADPSSLLLLEYLARQVRGARLLIAITARDGEAAPEVEASLARIRRDARRVVVGRLASSEIATMVGGRADAASLARVCELSGGNPLFVEELIACIAAHGTLERIGEITGMRALIRERIARLPAATVEALRAGALGGLELRAVVVADALALPRATLETRLAPALRVGVITRIDADRYRYSHGLVAESLAEFDAELHARLADALERIDGESAASTIAHHRLAIAHLDPVAAASAAERAARVAFAQLAFEDAAVLLERALAVLGTDPTTRKQQGGLLSACVEALQHAGEHARARELCTRGWELARATGDGVLLARLALARGIEFQFGLTDRGLVDMLQEALAAMPEGDSSLRARCLARLAAAEQPAADPTGPVATARDAIAMARRLGDRRTRLDVVHVAFAAMIEFVPAAELDVLLRELFVLATSPGDRLIALRNRLRHCFITLELADRAAFDAAVVAHAELADSIDSPRWAWHARAIAAMVALFEGRFDDARVAADAAEQLAAGDPQSEIALACHRWVADVTATRPATASARRTAEVYAYGRPIMQVVAAESRAAVERALAAAEPMIASDDYAAGSIAEIVVELGDRDRARSLYERLLSSRGRVWVLSMTAFALQDFADRCLLILASMLERWEDADVHARAALDKALRLDAAPWVARIQADWAASFDRRGAPASADPLWRAAAETAQRLGMAGLVERCRVARSTQVVVVVHEVVASDTVAIAREGALWVIEGCGCTARIRDARGVQMLARLIAEPGREIHALELVGDAVDTGDAGEHLDAKAKATYRKRLAELRDDLEEAEALRDADRAERARSEIDALAAELQRAIGLGGRERRAGAASERARSNAQRRLAYAIQQIRNAAPAIGDHLARRVRTGVYCVYVP